MSKRKRANKKKEFGDWAVGNVSFAILPLGILALVRFLVGEAGLSSSFGIITNGAFAFALGIFADAVYSNIIIKIVFYQLLL